MAQVDSVDKIVRIYLANVCRTAFEYKGQRFIPRPLRVSPLIFRGYTCPAMCGGCCPKFSLDYLPNEKGSVALKQRLIEINGHSLLIYSDRQLENHDHFCRHLNRKTGRCGIYETRPFSCDFELIRFIVPRIGPIHLTQKLFGRGWAMRRVDGGRGAKCQMLAADDYWRHELIRKLDRLVQWADYFAISTCLYEIISWVRAGPHDCPLIIPAL